MFFVVLEVESVVKEELFAFFNLTKSGNPDVVVFDKSFTVRVAAVINQTSCISGDITVYVPLVV